MSTHKHPLTVVFSSGPDQEQAVVRWCRTCGAVVVDVDADGRTQPGAIMPMKFPLVSPDPNRR